MSENASATELTSQYTAQVSADLERNTKEQDRVGAEIAALQEQLTALQRDHQVLVNIQQAIGPESAAAKPLAPSDSVTVPAPRKKTAAKKTAAKSSPGKRARTTKTAAKSSPAATKKAAGKATEKAATKSAPEKPAVKAEAAKTAQPTLVDLVRSHLTEQSEPRSAAEIATALGQAHPDRNIKTTVVRTTLEGLVARTQAQRSKQGASVYYTAPDASEQAASPQDEKQSASADA